MQTVATIFIGFGIAFTVIGYFWIILASLVEEDGDFSGMSMSFPAVAFFEAIMNFQDNKAPLGLIVVGIISLVTGGVLMPQG